MVHNHDDNVLGTGQIGQKGPSKRGELFSPRTVAKAIGVSESSLKRWCDAGKIGGTKTVGGHRRFDRANIVEFLKANKYDLIDPVSIGLPSFESLAVENGPDGAKQLLAALLAADEAQVTKLLMYLVVNGWKIAEIFDEIVSPTFEKIGAMWACEEIDVFQERRSCEICLNAFRDVRSIMLSPPEDAMTAIGCTIEGDHYMLPTLAVELTLTSQRWNASSLGSNLPMTSLLRAIQSHQPDLAWVSISHLNDADLVANQLNQLCKELPSKTTLVVGGYGVTPEFRSKFFNAICCDNLMQLVAAIRNLKKTEVQNTVEDE